MSRAAPIRRGLTRLLRILLGPGSARDPLGTAGEEAAAKFLKKEGYRILARNVRVRFGEADLLCLAPDRCTVVLAEVKTRRVESAEDRPYLPPEASITAEKRRKLIAVLTHLARANRWQGKRLRIDVVAVEWPASGAPKIRHHEKVVQIG